MDKLASMAIFVRIADKGSLTAAANDWGTSLPSVVRTLASLERQVGVRLINRTTRRIHLTDEGAQYLRHCRDILSAVHEAEAALTSRQGEPSGKLSVTASVLFGRRYVAPIVTDFVRRYPSVTAELLFVDRVVNIVDEGMDVAVRIGVLRDSSLVAIPVGEVRRVICATPGYLKRHGVPRTPQDIGRHRCVRHTGLAPRSEWHFRAGRKNVMVPVYATLTCNEIDSALAACRAGVGLGMFLSYQVAPARRAGQLRYVLEDFEADPVPVHVIYPYGRLLSTRLRRFVDECVQKLRATALD